MTKPRALVVLLLLAALTGGAKAAESPFEGDLVRLSEILGSLQDWRQRMEALLEAEHPDEARRARLTASFNRGYRGFETTYATCTASALAAIARYMEEGEALSRDTATRYGN
jgi:uncharacterized protein (TIGR02301 family)